MTEQFPATGDDRTGSYEDLLHQQGEELTDLRLRRGNPSLRTIEARARALFGPAASLPVSTQSAAFGGRYVGRDKLMWLVRTLMSWDEWGSECEPPGHRSPALDQWRTGWTAITAARPTRRRVPAPSGDTPAAPPPAVPRQESQKAAEDRNPRPGGLPVALPHSAEAVPFLPVPGALSAHLGTVYAVAFSPAGNLLATAGDDRKVRLWDSSTGELVGSPLTRHTGAVRAVAFSPDGRLLATGSTDQSVLLWESATGRPVGDPLTGHTGTVYSVAFSPCADLLATGGGDGDHTVRFWSAVERRPIGRPLTHHSSWIWSVAFSPDGNLLATAGRDRTVLLLDTVTGEPVGVPLTGHSNAVRAVAFSRDGRLLASGGRDWTAQLWDVAVRRRPHPPLTAHHRTVFAVAFSPREDLLATAGDDGTVRLWDSVTGEPVGAPLTGHAGAVRAVAFSPDGSLLATGGEDGTVRLYSRDRSRSLEARQAEFHDRAGKAVLNFHQMTANGSPHDRMPATTVYGEMFAAAEAAFRQGAEAGDVGRMVAAWSELTELAACLEHSSTALGATLLDLVVRGEHMSPQEAMSQAVLRAKSDPRER